MSKEYLSASEAIEILKIPPATFHRLASSGKITKHYPNPFSKHAEYDATEIARLKSKFRKQSEVEEKGETDWIKSSDMGAIYDLEYTVYGNDTGDPNIIRKWYERNPHMCRILYNKSNRKDVWGALNMVPLEEETIFKLLREEIRDIDLDPQTDILTFEKPGKYNFYIASVIVDPQKRQHFPLLVNSLFDFWCAEAPTRTIGKLYGRVITADGEMMAKKLFFSPLWNISENAYVLDVNRPNPSRLVQGFQHCLKTKETTQSNTKKTSTKP